jgi:16S rRNA processing protein RimM
MLLEVARVGRAHGIRGEVAVTLISDRDDRVVTGAEFVTDVGTLRVDSARRSGKGWLVHFAGITDRTAAEALAGTVLRAEADADAEGIWVHQVIGLGVVDQTGTPRGRVVAVQQNPAHDLLVLDDDVLVPAVFIVSIDEHITVDVPEGLFG